MRILIALQEKSVDFFDFVKNHKWNGPLSLHVVHVVESTPGTLPGYNVSPHLVEAMSNYAEGVAEFARRKLAEMLPEAEVTVSTPEGRATDRILEIAESWRADAIIIGSHGRGFLGRVFLGSVSVEVVSQAKCSVFVVANKPSEASEVA